MGRRCLKEGFGFHWNPYKQPYLVSPSGEKITLETSHDIPLLPDGFVSAALQQSKEEGGAAAGVNVDETRGDEGPAADDKEKHLLTHLPKQHDCDTCQIAKAQKKTCRRRTKC